MSSSVKSITLLFSSTLAGVVASGMAMFLRESVASAVRLRQTMATYNICISTSSEKKLHVYDLLT